MDRATGKWFNDSRRKSTLLAISRGSEKSFFRFEKGGRMWRGRSPGHKREPMRTHNKKDGRVSNRDECSPADLRGPQTSLSGETVERCGFTVSESGNRRTNVGTTIPFPVSAHSSPMCDGRADDGEQAVVFKITDYKAERRKIAAARRERFGDTPSGDDPLAERKVPWRVNRSTPMTNAAD
jgi:hypothetical protein